MAIEFEFQQLRQVTGEGRLHWQSHALARLLEPGISRREIVSAILHGEIIEKHPMHRPYPSCLIFGNDKEPLHVVAAVDSVARIGHVITAYRPDLEHFNTDFKTRGPKP